MRPFHSFLVVVGSITVLVALIVTSRAHTQAQEQGCFEQTGYCIDSHFLTYWQHNGGLPIFGYPISEAHMETNSTDGNTYLTQWFERNRMEHHSENHAPYDVLLGHLGVAQQQQLAQERVTVQQTNANTPYYFAETGYSIAPEFWQYWQRHGLEMGDTGMSERESLALFGYPVSQPAYVVHPIDGTTYMMQWFERARFEYHPGEQWDVQLGLLGNEAQGITPSVKSGDWREGIPQRPAPIRVATMPPSFLATATNTPDNRGSRNTDEDNNPVIPGTATITPTNTPAVYDDPTETPTVEKSPVSIPVIQPSGSAGVIVLTMVPVEEAESVVPTATPTATATPTTTPTPTDTPTSTPTHTPTDVPIEVIAPPVPSHTDTP